MFKLIVMVGIRRKLCEPVKSIQFQMGLRLIIVDAAFTFSSCATEVGSALDCLPVLLAKQKKALHVRVGSLHVML